MSPRLLQIPTPETPNVKQSSHSDPGAKDMTISLVKATENGVSKDTPTPTTGPTTTTATLNTSVSSTTIQGAQELSSTNSGASASGESLIPEKTLIFLNGATLFFHLYSRAL
jgi:hypothetical protein